LFDLLGPGAIQYQQVMTKDDVHCNLDPAVEDQGVKNILARLSDAEKEALADDEMPLRHFRAEKVRVGAFHWMFLYLSVIWRKIFTFWLQANTEKALKQIKATLAWREEFQVATLRDCFSSDDNANSSASDEEKKESTECLTPADFRTILLEENATGKIYVRGYDKDGRAVVYMQPGRENTSHEANNMRHLVWNMEKAIAVTHRQGFSKIVFVIDYTGFSLRNAPPLSTSRYTLDIMQKHYPERWHRFYLTNPPFIFKAFWMAVKPFVDPHTKEKIVFCTGSKGVAFLLDELGGDPSILEKCVGGTHTYNFNAHGYFGLPLDVAVDDDGLFAEAVKK
jgi:CRAL/TRIO domain